jgi:hypothetical protein
MKAFLEHGIELNFVADGVSKGDRSELRSNKKNRGKRKCARTMNPLNAKTCQLSNANEK